MSCLYELWLKTSAPVRHSATYWPRIHEHEIQKFIQGNYDSPVCADEGNLQLLQSDIQRIKTFLNEAQSNDALCKEEYFAYETHRLEDLQLIATALTNGSNDSILHIEEGIVHAAVSGGSHPSLPDKSSFMKARKTISEMFHDYLLGLTDSAMTDIHGPVLRASEIVSSVQMAIDDVLQEHLWKTQTVPSATNIYIDHATKTVNIPESAQFKPQYISGLIVHEVGAHIVRAERGARSHEPLAGVGMRGYSEPEEALGSMFEQIITGKENFEGLFLPFIVLDSKEKNGETFRSVYDAVFTELVGRQGTEFSEARLKHAAFTRCQRFMRLGTNEIVDVSGIKYAVGMAKLTAHINHDKETSIETILAGKYDLSNQSQLTLIRTPH